MIVSLHSIFSFGILTLFSQTISSNFSRLGPFSLQQICTLNALRKCVSGIFTCYFLIAILMPGFVYNSPSSQFPFFQRCVSRLTIDSRHRQAYFPRLSASFRHEVKQAFYAFFIHFEWHITWCDSIRMSYETQRQHNPAAHSQFFTQVKNAITHTNNEFRGKSSKNPKNLFLRVVLSRNGCVCMFLCLFFFSFLMLLNAWHLASLRSLALVFIFRSG